ncbi:MAG: glyoxalase/bleomycin resistance/extradiol dioxygenase family protein [Hydrogenophaga sp.]|jgi:predicted lactoylglutathione lyase|uniref:VOC family protein n=1 Tax=Hydrogenophaga sp. TaxID=1904254 RepID=UPI00271952A2|nr:VOC family protein [Hydrogenophaga sp.]MDO9483346.1 glyoxalase/bleomycin resistance/extradiol dioxygenase family protein [Hydrogenophaga sp.]MDP1896072.1 glyoxalase/bleomycin resistance/extradiol dioxygenase family protein [Hydrogenophaga sp.]MDP2096354.1 glyoxalase/bleomycin resistance/extradiol dioxygenase family protein [Hydrogenophaga sp.]MDP3343530.1 glyoxalase/bleomycin resistance/extradiol dioxygenase family protein [Hydrogenophaga sp.]MDP3808975.1 glyoxalase/bleomycin resistance/ext
MFRQIFVNLPIKDMARSQAFFKALGLGFNPRFTNEQGACLEIGDNFYAMLLVEPFFQGFTQKPIGDAHQATEVILALSVDSRAEVEAVIAKAVAAGATTPNEPKDFGFMFQHGFADLDGHQWEVFWMDEAAAPAQM